MAAPSIGLEDMDYPSESHAQMAFSVDSSHQAFQLSQEVHLFIYSDAIRFLTHVLYIV